MIGYVLEVAQAALALVLAPGVVGLVRWMKARLQNRRGAPVWQPYWELAKLFQKEVVVSNNASWLFRAAPFVVFASTVTVTFFVPILAVPLPFDGVGDLLVVVYLLLLGTFFLSLAGLDPGSPFGGMGASREMTVAALAEPTVALAIFALALSAGSTNLGQIVALDGQRPIIATLVHAGEQAVHGAVSWDVGHHTVQYAPGRGLPPASSCSIALPILPTAGLESKVEQTL